ncbi:VRR-NUC domain-containing protein [Pusillimonas sp.]|uniref:VRR-NUC domain-containing protein n=1 Tax=Pusillimonas sp. TaxID=3040095 RepID=UPI0037C6BB6A
MARQLDNPFYYLENFEFVLTWVGQRYADVLDHDELGFIQQYRGLPQASRALLARMVMRRGALFRHGRLHYTEIGCVQEALAPLAQGGWVNLNPLLNLEQAFGLFTKPELLLAFAGHGLAPALSKKAMFEHLSAQAAPSAFRHHEQDSHEHHSSINTEPPATIRDCALPLRQWWPDADDEVCELLIMPMCERFRLMFFGNMRQDWSEFVLADLGLYQYETVAFSDSCRAMDTRQDVDDYLHLHECAERLRANDDLQAIMACIPAQPYANHWIERRRAKLLFRIGQACERAQKWEDALQAYGASSHGEARVRRVRVLERTLQHESALLCAEEALKSPAGDAEAQLLARMQPRLRRKLGLPVQVESALPPPQTFQIDVPHAAAQRVEEVAREYLHRDDAPVHYVENTLINSLFGLLCWDAIFAPLPGAFFHPFQRGPADLHDPGFSLRRKDLLKTCLSQLESDQYRHTIQENFAAKYGRQCSFVHWPLLNDAVLQQALHCIPPTHLKKWCERLLVDIPGNRSGLPDLIQFQPATKNYRMIEVKGPGDRLQDNQRRWLAYFAQHGMPVAVCFVRWTESP